MSEDELLSAYLDGDLAPADRARVEELLAARPDLKEMVEDLVALRGRWSALPRVAAPADLAARIQRTIAAEAAPAKPSVLVEPPVPAKREIAPVAASPWLHPLIGISAAGALAASLALILALPGWLQSPVKPGVARHDPPAPPAQVAPKANTNVAPKAIAANPQQPGEQPSKPQDPAVAAAYRARPLPLPETRLPDRELPLPPENAGSTGPMPLPLAAAERVFGGAKPNANDRDGRQDGNAKQGRPTDENRQNAKGALAEAGLPEDSAGRGGSRALNENIEAEATIIDLELPEGLSAEQAIDQLVAAGGVRLTTDQVRLRAAAGAFADAKPAADRQARGGELLVMELDAAKAERVLTTVAAWSPRKKMQELEQSKNGLARRRVPLAKLETNLDEAAEFQEAAGIQPAALPAIAAAPAPAPAGPAPAAPGAAPPENRAATFDPPTDKIVAQKNARNEHGWAMVLRDNLAPAAEKAEVRKLFAAQAAAPQPARPGDAAGGRGRVDGPEVQDRLEFQAGAPGGEALAKRTNRESATRQLVIRFHAPADAKVKK